MLNIVTEHQAAHAGDQLLVRFQRAGGFLLEQYGRDAVLNAGEITVFDLRHPLRGQYLAGSRQFVVKLPRRELEARIGDVRSLIARPIKPSEGIHGFLFAYLSAIPTYLSTSDGTSTMLIRDHTIDLIAQLLAKSFDRGSLRMSRARALVLANLRVAIEARLTDPSLDAAQVAAAAGVSVRYASAVLADENTTIMHLVRARRLERCRQALSDSSQAHRTIGEIAYGWGFSDMTHFGRCFRTAYGLLPRDYRRHANSRTW